MKELDNLNVLILLEKSLITLFSKIKGFEIEKEKNGIIIRYKQPENTPTVTLMMETEIDIPCI